MDDSRPDPESADRTNAHARGVPPAAAIAGAVPIACVASSQLLRGGNEVLIEHHGALYRLRQTSLGKLILTK